MDESQIWLSLLLKNAQDSYLHGPIQKKQLRHMLLYSFAAQIIDWRSFKGSRGTSKHDTKQERIHTLLQLCGRSDLIEVCDINTCEELASLVRTVLADHDSDELRTLFDSLFYYIVTETGFDRRHAEIVAALTSGLARRDGILDLAAYSGEPFIQCVDPGSKNIEFEFTDGDYGLFDLTRLRLIVWEVEANLLQDASRKLNRNNLTLLDNPADASSPFSRLAQRLEDGQLTKRTLMVFKPGASSAHPKLDALRKTLQEEDLLEAVFDFTSYNPSGKPTRCCAWLLNQDKAIGLKTLCIDTRHLADTAYGVSPQQIAYFAAAIYEGWASPRRFRLGQYPKASRLGPLKGLFSQWFGKGRQTKDGLCEEHYSADVLKGALTEKRVERVPVERNLSLLDRSPLDELLEATQGTPACAYIIGNNGTGKSLALASLVFYLQQKLIASVAIVMGPIDRFPLENRKKYPKYRYLGDRTSTGYSSRAIERRLIDILVETVHLPGRMELLETVLDLLGFKQRLYLAPEGAFTDLLQPLDLGVQVRPLTEAVQGSTDLKNLRLALPRKGDSNLLKFSDLSSGEQQVMFLFAKILVSAGPGTVLLVDEPEISLHVRWQQLLPSVFSLMAEKLQSRFVIATHSPTLIANAQDELSHCFLANSDLQLQRIPLEQRHSVETILLEGFQTYTPHNREVAERCAALVTEAIKATNRGVGSFTDIEKTLEGKLKVMEDIIARSGNSCDERCVQDKQLISQAGDAIAEIFKFAQQAIPT